MTVPLLSVERVSMTFTDPGQRLHALHEVTFAVQESEFVSLLGPSGSGKSTLLRIAAGLIKPDSGEMRFAGEPVVQPRPEIALAFQSAPLMPWRTVRENLRLPLEVKGALTAEAEKRVDDLLSLVGLSDFADTWPRQLSGGMAQRVALARTLILRPRLLLMDEPFGALDALTRERLNMELLRLQQQHGLTVLMVTHNIAEAVLLSDRILILSHRPGTLVADLPIDLPRPRSLAQTGTAEFAALTLRVRNQIGD
jgi:NitT/TauT family transport system ATP-binding protein